MEIVPNLHFNGNCEQAIALYERAFCTERTVFLRNRNANPMDADEQPGAAQQNFVYHAEMRIGGQRIMLNDHDDAHPPGENISLLVSMDSVEGIKTAYEVLKEDARILIPLRETTYSSAFVSLVDRYGIRWELMKEGE